MRLKIEQVREGEVRYIKKAGEKNRGCGRAFLYSPLSSRANHFPKRFGFFTLGTEVYIRQTVPFSNTKQN